MPPAYSVLVELAAAFGVASEYWDWQGQHVAVPDQTLAAVLAALGVDTSGEQSRAAALERRRTEPWRSVLPSYVVAREGVRRNVAVHVDHGVSVDVWVELEDGSFHSNLTQAENSLPPSRDRRAPARRGELRHPGRSCARLPQSLRIQRRRAQP